MAQAVSAKSMTALTVGGFRLIFEHSSRILSFQDPRMVADTLNFVRDRMAAACERAGRNPADVLLVAVSKTFGVEAIREAAAAGQRDFGENYVQELNEKQKRILDQEVRWHFIGHLQTNKAKNIVEFVHLIHSVDSERVAAELERRAERINRTLDVLLEVHTTDEATKYGVLPEKTVELAKQVSRLKRVRIRGLMTIGPFSQNPDDSRSSFRQLVDLKKSIEVEGIEDVTMRHLSMGMTHDFEAAIEEGATIVRIGTAIFGKRKTALGHQTEGAL
jgi:pyridoxal phosphate enzyme (YggS family)